jgi:DNA-binding phage protein
MAKKKLTSYDPAEDLGSDEAIAIFMAEAFQTNDVAYISQTALSREQLYRSFSKKGNPTLKTTLAVMKALGIELTAKTAA